MILLEQLHKSYGERPAVTDVSFVARDGRITGLLGANGAGKTTTLRLLSGLLRPDRGRVCVDGLDVQDDPQAARRRLGLLSEAHGLYGRLTARENVAYFAALQGLHAPAARIDELLSSLGLQDDAERPAAQLSRGQQMKVALARSLVHDPPNLVLDEPTNGLDVATVRVLRGVLSTLRERGRCVLFSSHVMSEVAALCDQVVVLVRGQVAASGTPQEVAGAAGGSSLEDAVMSLAVEGTAR